MPCQDDCASDQYNPPCRDDPPWWYSQSDPNRCNYEEAHEDDGHSRSSRSTSRCSLGAEKIRHVEERLQKDIASPCELLEGLDNLIQGLLVLSIGDLGVSPDMFRLFLADARLPLLVAGLTSLSCALGRRISVLASRFGPSTTTERTIPPAVHASNEGHAYHDRPSPCHYHVSIENDSPEEAD